MINNTFFIVCRERDMNSPNHNLPGRRMDWKTAEKELREYQAAMPSHVVRIRACRIGENYGLPE